MKTIATIHKEFLLLIRDPAGLALIFLMPLSLVIVMALVQDAPFRDYQELKLEVLYVDLDGGALSEKIKKSFSSSPNIVVVQENDSAKARQKVKSGEFKAAMIIPAQASQALQKKSGQVISKMLSNVGLPATAADTIETPALNIIMLYDPAIKMNYKQTLTSGIEKILANTQTESLMTELQTQLETGDSKKSKMDFSNLMQVREQYASENKMDGIVLSSVQHNVPAWAMFAMFFILFPLAGNFIKEREEGSMLRLRLISGSYLPAITGKFIFYFLVCLLQFLIMIAAGILVMPLLGLEQLTIGNNIVGIAIAALSVAMAATSYGLLIATYFQTAQQALSFGSVSVVILAAIGGIWVPVFVMPEILQTISVLSPLNWGLEIFNDLFLRGATIRDISPGVLKLLCFSLLAVTLSIFVHKVKSGV